MKRQSSFEQARDRRIADDVSTDDASARLLMCAAVGCPNVWTVSNGRLCSAHAWSDPHAWPRITQEQIDAQTERALRNTIDSQQPAPAPLSLAQKAALIRRLRGLFAAPRDPLGWADALRNRERDGEPLSAVQRAAWREALRFRSQADAP